MASANDELSIPPDARKRSQSIGRYDAPESYRNLDDAPATLPLESPTSSIGLSRRRSSIRQRAGSTASEGGSQRRRRSTVSETRYTVPDDWANLDELAAPAPVENIQEGELYQHESLEGRRSLDRDWQREQSRRRKSLTQDAQLAPPELEST